MTGLTNYRTDADSNLTGYLSAEAVEPAHDSAATATAASEPGVDPNSAPDFAADSARNAAPDVAPNPDSWRVEVAARLERYRTRRKPRTPRYPSLLLPFDAPDSWSRSASPTGCGSPPVAIASARAEQDPAFHQDLAFHMEEGPATVVTRFAETRPASQKAEEQAPESSANVIEFPRSAAIPVFHSSDLADPVFDRDRPRIVEAPEILPPPPALGGMLIEPADREPVDRRADFACVSPSASRIRRALAALVDGAVLAASLAAFAAVVFYFNPLYFNPNLRLDPGLSLSLHPIRGPLPLLAGTTIGTAIGTTTGTTTGTTIAGALVVVAVLLWAVYEFLFVVYTGSTPGLRAAGLHLAAFDGTPLNRRLRRWRVLASFLSGLSAGLGYFWCFLDQNGLCWHDRITRTHVRSLAQ